MILKLAVFLAWLVMGTLAHLAGERAGHSKNAGADPDELMYLPEGSIMRLLSLGHPSFLADLVWFRAIQYYGEHRLTDRNYDQAERLFRVIWELDPYFKGAVRFGALVLSQDAGNPWAGLALLQQASKKDPDSWEYPFDQGFIFHTVLRNYRAAGEAYRRASRIPGAPDLAGRLAGVSFARLGDRDTAREVWKGLASSENAMMRDIATRSLANIDMEERQELLTEATARFREAAGRLPVDWRELVLAGHIEEVPTEPFGGRFLLDPETGQVWASTHIDRRMAANRDRLARLVEEVYKLDGSFPASVEEALERDGRIELWEPFGINLDYDPTSGKVSWNPPWPATEPHNQGEGHA